MKKHIKLATTLCMLLGQPVCAQWVPTNKPEGGIVQALCASRGSLFAGTRGGLYTSTNNGTSWRKLTTPMEAGGVYSLLVNGGNLFLGTGDNPAVSTDGGNSWTVIENGLPGWSGIVSLAQIGTLLFAGTYIGAGVFVSTNNGGNWSQVNAGLPDKPVLSLAGRGANLYAGTDGAGVFLSTNEGLNWIARNDGLTNSTVHTILANGTDLFAGTDGGLFLSTDNGTTWTETNAGLTSVVVYALLASGTSVFAGTRAGVFLSTDDGRSWTAPGLANYAVYSLLVTGATLFAGTGGGVFLSTDNGTSWKAANTGLTRSWSLGWAVEACDSNTATISISPSAVFQTVDGGSTWREMQIGAPAETAIDISTPDVSHIWVCTDRGRIYRTTDGGVTWAVRFYDTSKTKFFNYIKMFDLNNGLAEGDGPPSARALVLKTTDGGDHWTSLSNSLGGSSASIWQRIDFVDPNVGYFFVSGSGPQGLFKTTDGGITWSETHYPPVVAGNPPYAEVIRFYDERVGLTIPGEGMVFRTVDGGTNWELLTSPHTGWGNDIEFVPGDPSKVWMTDYSKLYFSTDTGRTWTEKLSIRGGRDIIFVNDKYGWFLGDDSVLYRTTTGGLVGVVHRGTPVQPETFSLQQNYPNPFNPSTTIEFSLSHSAYVTLKISNLLGAEVATVVAQEFTAGSYRARWDATGFPSGVYFYRLVAGSLVETRRMVLLK